MNSSRLELVKEFWDRSTILNLDNKEYFKFVNSFFQNKIKEDFVKNDITSLSLIKDRKNTKSVLISKSEGILAGIDECSVLSKMFGLKAEILINDNSPIKKSDKILELHGDIKSILGIERIFLNVIQRMSGIATITNYLQNKIKDNAKIAATRKTLWGMLDKKAVSVGNGITHRLNLSDGILIKDNHIEFLKNDIALALELADSNTDNRFIEIEVRNINQALATAEKIQSLKTNSEKLFAIMFDNMDPNSIKNILSYLKNKKLFDSILFEASGDINESNIFNYSKTGVDIISMGFITHSSKSLNMSLEILS